MPRLPVDGKKVVEHRLSLGTFERQQLDQITGAIQFRRISTPIVTLLNDVTGLAAVYVIVNSLFPDWHQGLPIEALEAYHDDPKGLRDYFEAQNILGAVVGGVVGVATGGLAWIPAILGGAVSQLVVEGAEEAYKDVEEPVRPPIRTIMFMLSARRAAKEVGYIE